MKNEQPKLVINLAKEYGRCYLPNKGARKLSKKQQIINRVINKARQLAEEPITGKQANALQRFIADRLSTHGRLGYQFEAVVDYHKQMIPASDTNAIALYVLDSNHIETIK